MGNPHQVMAHQEPTGPLPAIPGPSGGEPSEHDQCASAPALVQTAPLGDFAGIALRRLKGLGKHHNLDF